MNELIDTKLKRPMDRAISGSEVTALNALVNMMNNPEITGASVPEGEVTKAPLPRPAAALELESHIEETPAPVPAPVRSNASKLFFTGKLRVGKDHIAKAVGAHIFGFADPIYKIASDLTGIEISSTKGKDLPGVRALLQAIGQWGRNEVNMQYPITPARILFVKMVRAQFPTHYESFGIDKDLWIADMFSRFDTWAATAPAGKRAAATNVRFENEFKALTSAGWTHWHVMCSPATWTKRLEASKLTPSSIVVQDMSEALATFLDTNVIKQISAQKNGPMLRCIWNDDTVKPPSARLHTLNSFLQTLAISEVPSLSDDSDILTGE